MKDIHSTVTVLRFSTVLATFLNLNVQNRATNCERTSTIFNQERIQAGFLTGSQNMRGSGGEAPRKIFRDHALQTLGKDGQRPFQ